MRWCYGGCPTQVGWRLGATPVLTVHCLGYILAMLASFHMLLYRPSKRLLKLGERLHEVRIVFSKQHGTLLFLIMFLWHTLYIDKNRLNLLINVTLFVQVVILIIPSLSLVLNETYGLSLACSSKKLHLNLRSYCKFRIIIQSFFWHQLVDLLQPYMQI